MPRLRSKVRIYKHAILLAPRELPRTGRASVGLLQRGDDETINLQRRGRVSANVRDDELVLALADSQRDVEHGLGEAGPRERRSVGDTEVHLREVPVENESGWRHRESVVRAHDTIHEYARAWSYNTCELRAAVQRGETLGVDIPLNLKLALRPGVFATCLVPLKPYVWLVNACHGPEYTMLSLKSSIVTLFGQSAMFAESQPVDAVY